MATPSRGIYKVGTKALTPESLDNKLARIESTDPISRVEFIIRPQYIICNVMHYGQWRSTTLEVGINIIEFLERGSMASVKDWKRGRTEDND